MLQKLPCELQKEIFYYLHEMNMIDIKEEMSKYFHKIKMNNICEEIDDLNYVYCDNEYCDNQNNFIYLLDDSLIKKYIINYDAVFCCQSCLDEGEYWIRYDYRKSLRRK